MLAPFSQHNHQACIDTALQQAHRLCQAAGVKLTQQRLAVLRLIWRNHQPLGAYALMEMLKADQGKPVAPPTVYRALEFLLEHGLIHRVHSLNAFVGCSHAGQVHTGNLLICRACGCVQELHNQQLPAALNTAAQEQGFVVEQMMVEMVGLCTDCQPGATT